MNRLDPSGLVQFARQFRFVGGKLRRAALRFRGETAEILVRLAARRALHDLGARAETVGLTFRLVGVEEFRFQKRLNTPADKINDLRLGYFQGLFFVNFDAWAMPPGEAPALHDFRASERYAAARDLFWEERLPRSA